MSPWYSLLLGIGLCHAVYGAAYTPKVNIGVPAGLIPDCPGTLKNLSISAAMLPRLVLNLQRYENNQVVKKTLPIGGVVRSLLKDKRFRLASQKTVLYACGFFDSAVFPHTQAIANSLTRRGYNVLVADSFSFLTNIYPISARLTRTIGHKLGEMLAKLYEKGLNPENLELIGISLGAQIVSYAAKTFFRITGKKPARLTGLDPAGPCFRSLPVDERLNPSDAHQVSVLHTNIDGFGMADAMGHVDFYANGGEYQPGDIPFIPCLVICSHLRSVIYYWQALEHPKKFIGVECDTIQSARLAQCYNNTGTNVLGLNTNFNKPGVYYLPTNNEFPYYRGKEGLKAENEIYTSVARSINANSNIVK